MLGTDGQIWWLKPPGQNDLDFALSTEFVVARVGQLIGAPTCTSMVVEITRDLEHYEFRRGRRLREGFGHATLAVDAAQEVRGELRWRTEDDNKSRQVGIYALYDWCWGCDDQWLHCVTSDKEIYSHDHGCYLPPSGHKWDVPSLQKNVDIPHLLGVSPIGLSNHAIEAVAQSLEKVDKSGLLQILRTVPTSWPVHDNELETLGWFLERRAPAVAARLRNLI